MVQIILAGVRVKPGERLRITAWTHVISHGYSAIVSGVYDDGTPFEVEIREMISTFVSGNTLREISQVSPAFMKDGTILSGGIFSKTGDEQMYPGQVWAVLELGTSFKNDNTLAIRALCYGYLTASVPIMIGTFNAPGTGPGRIYELGGADPAAGAECIDVVPTGLRWKLRAYQVVLAAAAVAITRTPNLYVLDLGGTLIVYRAAGGTWTTGQTETGTWIFGNGANVDAAAVAIGVTTYNIAISVLLPVLQSGDIIATITTNLQGADDYGAPQFTIEEWVMPESVTVAAVPV